MGQKIASAMARKDVLRDSNLIVLNRIFYIGQGVTVGAAYAMFERDSGQVFDFFLLVIPMIIANAALFWYSRAYAALVYAKRVDAAGPFPVNYKLIANNEGFNIESNQGTGTIPWAQVKSISEKNGMIVVITKTLSGVSLPVGAFANSEQKDSFKKMLVR